MIITNIPPMKSMDENAGLIELLFEKVTDYGKVSLKLAKLKALDKTSEIISTLIPKLIFNLFIISFMFFFNIGVAYWLGEILGVISYGFYAVAAFYGFAAIFLRLFMYKWLKRFVRNNFINQVLN